MARLLRCVAGRVTVIKTGAGQGKDGVKGFQKKAIMSEVDEDHVENMEGGDAENMASGSGEVMEERTTRSGKNRGKKAGAKRGTGKSLQPTKPTRSSPRKAVKKKTL